MKRPLNEDVLWISNFLSVIYRARGSMNAGNTALAMKDLDRGIVEFGKRFIQEFGYVARVKGPRGPKRGQLIPVLAVPWHAGGFVFYHYTRTGLTTYKRDEILLLRRIKK